MWSTLAFLGVGLVITLLAQSSTVSTALILSLSATTDLPIISAAAAIIGIYLILPMVDKLTRAEANQTE